MNLPLKENKNKAKPLSQSLLRLGLQGVGFDQLFESLSSNTRLDVLQSFLLPITSVTTHEGICFLTRLLPVSLKNL